MRTKFKHPARTGIQFTKHDIVAGLLMENSQREYMVVIYADTASDTVQMLKLSDGTKKACSFEDVATRVSHQSWAAIESCEITNVKYLTEGVG